MGKKYRSDALAAVHETAVGLTRRASWISGR